MAKPRRFVYHDEKGFRQHGLLMVDTKARTVGVPAVTLRGPGDVGNLINALQGAQDLMERKAERDNYAVRLVAIHPKLSQTMRVALKTLHQGELGSKIKGQLRRGAIASRTEKALIQRGLVMESGYFLILTRRGYEALEEIDDAD